MTLSLSSDSPVTADCSTQSSVALCAGCCWCCPGRAVLPLCYLGRYKLHLLSCSLCVPLAPSALSVPAWPLGFSFPPCPDSLVTQWRCQGDLQALCGAEPVLAGRGECVAVPCWAGGVKLSWERAVVPALLQNRLQGLLLWKAA